MLIKDVSVQLSHPSRERELSQPLYDSHFTIFSPELLSLGGLPRCLRRPRFSRRRSTRGVQILDQVKREGR
jgi:hypothetical protein